MDGVDGMSTMNDKEFISSGRLHHLDAIRGIAALSVLLGHCYGSSIEKRWVVMMQRPAVTIFFILSGYVLSKSLMKSCGHPVVDGLSYCVRRFFRLYPAIFVAVILAAILTKFYVIPSPQMDVNPWLSKNIFKATTIHSLHDYIGSFRLYYMRLDPVFWTLQVEFFCSFLLPLLIWPTRNHLLVRWALLPVLGYIKLFHAWVWCGYPGFLFEFYLGYLAWTLFPKFSEINPKTTRLLILLNLVGVYIWMLKVEPSLVGLSSCIIVAALIAILGPCNWNELKSTLQAPLPQFLGKISYSLYLIHLPIMFFCWSVIWGKGWIPWYKSLSPNILAILVLLITIPLATGLERFVEQPFNKLGHRLSGGLEGALKGWMVGWR